MFLPDCGSDTTVLCTLYLHIVVCTVDLGTCSCFEMAPSDFPSIIRHVWKSAAMGHLSTRRSSNYGLHTSYCIIGIQYLYVFERV